MKAEILQEKLSQGVGIVRRSIGKTTNLPILEGIKLNFQKNFLCLTATDLEVGIKWWILSNVEKQGEIVIPAKILSNLTSLTTQEKIKLKGKEDSLTIKDKNNQTVIQGLKKEDFPTLPKVDKKNKVTIKSQKIKEGLSKVINCVASSQIRPEISGVLMKIKKNKLTLVGTDSYRLAKKIITLDQKVSGKHSLIIPQKTIQQLVNILSQVEGELDIYINDSQVLFEMSMEETDHPQFQLISRLIEGSYPDYQSIIPKKGKTIIQLDRKEFLNQVKTASIFSGRINEVKLSIEKDKQDQLQVEAENSKFGRSKSTIEAQIKGNPMEISFNYRYLTDALKTISTPEVVLHLTSNEKPGLLQPVDDDSHLYVLMPLKS